MGLKDRLRETAQVAQDGLAKGQAKLDEYQSRQAYNDQLRALGQAYWVQQSGRATPEQLQAALETLGTAIREAEMAHGELPWPTMPAPAPAEGVPTPIHDDGPSTP